MDDNPKQCAFELMMNMPSKKFARLPTKDKELKAYLDGLIKSNSQRITYQPMDATGATVWKHFQHVLVDGQPIEIDDPEKGKIHKNFIQCKYETSKCKMLYKYAKSNGSSTQNGHLVSVHNFTVDPVTNELNEPQPKVISTQPNSCTAVSTLQRHLLKKLPSKDYAKLKSSLIYFVANEMRPFEIVEGDGFLRLCELLVELGHKHGLVDIRKIMPVATTVSRNTEIVYNAIKAKLIEEFASVDYFGVVLDHWSDKSSTKQYLAIGVQYIYKDEIQSRVIGTVKSDYKTFDLTCDLVEVVLTEYNIWHKRKIFVCDNALVDAFDTNEAISCASHNANLVQKHCFDLSDKEKSILRADKRHKLVKQIENYHKLIETCNSLVSKNIFKL